MAIFGNLRDIGLLELLPLLAHQTGRLVLVHKEGSLEVYLAKRRVVCAEAGRRVLSPTQLEEKLFQLAQARAGSFEFFPGETPKHRRGCYNLSVDELVLKLATLRDEIESASGELPLPDTVFTLGNVATAYANPTLAEFLDRAWPHLSMGASARQLARALDLPLERVRYLLYKLRALGAVQPLERRAKVSEERRGLAGRLLGLLRRRFGKISWSL